MNSSSHLRSASFAVLIPTKDRPADLGVTVSTVLRQSVLPRQLIIVDQSPDEQSERAARTAFAQVDVEIQKIVKLDYLRDTSITGASMARNRGLALLHSCDFVLFLDDDVVLEDDFIESILDGYERYPHASGISGIVTNYSPPSGFSRWWSAAFVRGIFFDDRQPIYWQARNLGSLEPVKVTRFGGGLMSFRRDAIEGVLFDEGLQGACDGEDVDFCMHLRPDAILLISPKARLLHVRSPLGRQPEHWLSRHCRTMWYLYRRNWNSGLWNRLCFLWLNVGYVTAASLSAVYRFSLEPLRALSTAIAQSKVSLGRVEQTH